MNVSILYITYNRIDSTKLTLPKLLNSTEYLFNLTIVDNGSTDNTADYLRDIVGKYYSRKPIKLILNRANEGLSKPTNTFWRESKADLVGKIDNDILVENGWLEKLIDAHERVHDLAIIGGFHFPMEAFSHEKCKHNIYELGGIKMLRQPYIGGNYLAKRNILEENGYLDERVGSAKMKIGGWTKYQLELSQKGYIIGYYYPLIRFSHLRNGTNRYYKQVRGVSKRKYFRWEKKDAEKMLYKPWEWET